MPDQITALPPAVKALSAPKRAAWQALAEGGRFKDAAAAAGVTVNTVWRWCKDAPFKSCMSAAYLPHADAARTVVSKALQEAQDDTDERAMDRGLKAAQMVQRALGIGVGGAAAAPASPSTLNLQVNLVGVLPSAAQSTGPVVDVRTATAELAQPTVADSQPIRSRASSRKPTR